MRVRVSNYVLIGGGRRQVTRDQTQQSRHNIASLGMPLV